MAAPIDPAKVFVREVELNNGKLLCISQYAVGDVGCVVWDAAIVLSKYLETQDFDFGRALQNKTIVELGAGTGIVGLVAACYGSSVTVTDLEEFVPLMKMNIEANRAHFTQTVTAEALKWGTTIDQRHINTDIVLVADCIYYEESLEPLVQCMEALCGPATCIFCSYEERTTGNKPELQQKFLQLCGDRFKMEKIPTERQNQEFCSEDIHVYKMTKLKK